MFNIFTHLVYFLCCDSWWTGGKCIVSWRQRVSSFHATPSLTETQPDQKVCIMALWTLCSSVLISTNDTLMSNTPPINVKIFSCLAWPQSWNVREDLLQNKVVPPLPRSALALNVYWVWNQWCLFVCPLWWPATHQRNQNNYLNYAFSCVIKFMLAEGTPWGVRDLVLLSH